MSVWWMTFGKGSFRVDIIIKYVAKEFLQLNQCKWSSHRGLEGGWIWGACDEIDRLDLFSIP